MIDKNKEVPLFASRLNSMGSRNSYITPDELKCHPLLGNLYNKEYLGG